MFNQLQSRESCMTTVD